METESTGSKGKTRSRKNSESKEMRVEGFDRSVLKVGKKAKGATKRGRSRHIGKYLIRWVSRLKNKV